MHKMRRRASPAHCFGLDRRSRFAGPAIGPSRREVPCTDAPACCQCRTPSEPLVIDVALASGGELTGHVVGQDGTCTARETVYVLAAGSGGRHLQNRRRAADFALTGLTGGVYDVRWAHGVTICRLWAPQTAPPSAKSDLLLTANATVVRGQTGHPDPGHSLLKGPLPWIAVGRGRRGTRSGGTWSWPKNIAMNATILRRPKPIRDSVGLALPIFLRRQRKEPNRPAVDRIGLAMDEPGLLQHAV